MTPLHTQNRRPAAPFGPIRGTRSNRDPERTQIGARRSEVTGQPARVGGRRADRGLIKWRDRRAGGPVAANSAGRGGPFMTRIAIYDTTLRDGSQGEGVNFSLQDKLAITARLDGLGVDYVEGGYPLSNPKDAAYFREIRGLDLRHTRVTAFGMTRRKGVSAEDDTGMRALVDAGTPAVTVVGKSWDFQAREVLNVSLDENLRMISDS